MFTTTTSNTTSTTTTNTTNTNTNITNTNNRKLSNPSPSRNQLVERCSSIRGCEPCKRRKRICNGQKPCTHCTETSQECVYSVVSDHARSVFSTSTARRLSSGSACETCRRRKTKCDGCSPCSFCASSGIECINNSERRKRSVMIPTALSISTSNTEEDHEAMDRIEDRLRRIERLMTAFTPSTHQFSKEIKDIKRVTAGFRKLSSPHLQKPSSLPTTTDVRQQRHSIQGPYIQTEKSKSDKILPYPTPPHSHHHHHDISTPHHAASTSPSPPLSPRTLRQSSSSMANSMLNLSLSPSSSTSSSSSSTLYHHPIQPSTSTPTSPLAHHTENEWKQSTPIPSLMGK